MKVLIVILGPTGVGKSALCLEVAKHLGVSIINCDSRQMYRELPVGTAAPPPEDLKEVKHHFVGNLSIHDYYSASRYEQEVLELMESDDSKVHLLSGGSMMYIDAVCNGIDDIPTVREDIRKELLDRYAAEGIDRMREELKLLDPEYYAIVDLKNPKRIIHALEICYQTGKTYTSFRTNTKKERPFKVVKVGLNRDREELYDRINRRVLQMIKDGMIEEARSVYEYRGLNSLNTVGYKELFQYFDGELTLDEAIEKIQNNTRKYARKQLTWFRRDENIKWFNPEDKDEVVAYIDMAIQGSI
ncbi:MAG: tRNA (adenosine(37)-N6)-dimethylallyltransferase MiaA [Bacteroidaceae bacterium]|nr:tRNA (adenosine(37)-N6)-dimethylallyltransferase MiaA [Bacteroidaceae bacterium]